MSKKLVIDNEKRLNRIKRVIDRLNKDIDSFNNIEEDIKLLNDYYGSNEWYTDIKNFDNGIYGNINAGVLSEDGIWNTLEEYKELKDLFK